jgi:hypothetical protein
MFPCIIEINYYRLTPNKDEIIQSAIAISVAKLVVFPLNFVDFGCLWWKKMILIMVGSVIFSGFIDILVWLIGKFV